MKEQRREKKRETKEIKRRGMHRKRGKRRLSERRERKKTNGGRDEIANMKENTETRGRR